MRKVFSWWCRACSSQGDLSKSELAVNQLKQERVGSRQILNTVKQRGSECTKQFQFQIFSIKLRLQRRRTDISNSTLENYQYRFRLWNKWFSREANKDFENIWSENIGSYSNQSQSCHGLPNTKAKMLQMPHWIFRFWR